MTRRGFFIATALVSILLISVLSGGVAAPANNDFSFAIISDVHVPTYAFPIGLSLEEDDLMEMKNQKRLVLFADEILAMETKPDFVINNGDTGDAGWKPLLKLYVKLMQPLVKAGIPVYTVVGNHDHDYAGIGREDLAEFFDPLGPEMIGGSGSLYSFEYKGCHIAVMNNRPISGLIRFNPKDIEWLKNDLATVDKDTRILLFIHANMQDEDTHHIVELLQSFSQPTIFYGHSHRSAMRRWGGIPVVNTGSLWGGTPEAGSYRMVRVSKDAITVKTRDFSDPAGTFGPSETVVFQTPLPAISISGTNPAILKPGETIKVETANSLSGTLEYKIAGISDWAPAQGANGKWSVAAPEAKTSGRYLLALRFTSTDSSIVLGHKDIIIPGGATNEVWAKSLGSAIQGAPVLHSDLAIIPTIESGVYALNVSNGREAWHRATPEGQILGRMALIGGTAFYAAGRTVQAVNAVTGELLWNSTVDGTVIAGITAGTDRLFIPTGENKLSCLSAANGRLLWDFTVRLPIIMETATDGKRVFFGAMDGCFYALDIKSGKEIWKKQWSPLDDRYTTAPFWPPVATGKAVIFAKNPASEEEKNLVALDAASGKVLWTRQVSTGTFRSALSPGKDKLYISDRIERTNGVQCISVKDGSTLWSEGTGISMNAAIVTGDVVIQRDAYNLAALDSDTGKLAWKYRTDSGPQGSYYGPSAFAVSETLVIAGTMGGYVIALKL